MMKISNYFIFTLILAGFISCTGSQSATTSEPSTDLDELLNYQDGISVDFMREHLTVLAHDSLEGRETAMPGQKKAAEYIVSQYKEMGIQPAGENGSYLQGFDLLSSEQDSVVYETSTPDGEVFRSVASKESAADYLRAFGGSDTLQGEIVFAGFGVNDTGGDVHHLEGAEIEGKWVMVFQEIPHTANGDTLISPNIDARSRFQEIIEQGAEGILLIPDMSMEEFNQNAEGMKMEFGSPEGMRLAYLEEEENGGFSKGYNLISPQLAANILQLDDASALPEFKQKLIEKITDFRPEELKWELSQVAYNSDVTLETENILAVVEGADPELKDEYIVMTSHYDHVGISQPDSTGDKIYNGADDDGSGTVGIMNVAKALVEAEEDGYKPKRSILFLHVSGEEKGLLGSQYYSDHPVVPLEQTIANINVDMIGRVDEEHEEKGVEEYAYIIGSEIISSELDSLLQVANKRSGQIELNKKYNDLKDPNQFYRRSDHWHFGRHGIPFIFFFTGVHEDYHRPSDEVHKIKFDKMEKIVRTMYTTAVMLADVEEPPAVDNQEFIEITRGN